VAELKEQLASVRREARSAKAAAKAAAAAAAAAKADLVATTAAAATTAAVIPATTIAPTTSAPLVRMNATNTSKKAGDLPSLFCFAVSRTTGQEAELVKAQYRKAVGIFACNAYLVLSSPAMSLGVGPSGGSPLNTTAIPATSAHTGHFGVNGELTNSWLNTVTFMAAWEAVREDGRLWHYDWTVKSDPDNVLLPDRLRSVLAPHTPHGGAVEYLLNCNRWPANPLLYGAVEVFSKKAVGAYYDGVARCKKDLPWHGFGEDLFMQKCMDMIGVKSVGEFDMVSDTNCFSSPCTDHGKAAFHPFKSPAKWFDCWGQATQLRL